MSDGGQEVNIRVRNTDFISKLDEWIRTAHAWPEIAEGPVINIKLTEMQEAELAVIVKTLEGVKKMYEEMMDGE